MSIEKLELVSIVGELPHLNDAIVACLQSKTFHLENAAKLLGSSGSEESGGSHTAEVNPYAEPLKHLTELDLRKISIDLTQEPLLDITIITGYKNTAVTGCRYTQNGLKLTVSYLKTNEISDYTVRYAIPIPENLTVEPENCTVEYVAMTDESEYQALLTDSLCFELDH